MRIGFASHPGMVRGNNEDFIIIDEEIGLFLIADGVGGHQSGEIASCLGAETIHASLKEVIDTQIDYEIEQAIREAFKNAHHAIISNSSTEEENKGMATTVVLCLFQNSKVYVAHVGDSRAYVIDSHKLTQLTEDHSPVANLVRKGEISKKVAKSHKMKHMVAQCLGSDQYWGPDIKNLNISNDEIFLLCSDGLTDMVSDKDIQKVLNKKKGDLQKHTDELVNLANRRGGRDNISVILIEN